MLDTHCHLTFPDYKGRVPDVLAEAAAHGIRGCITISTTTLDCLDALAVARTYPNVWCTAGVHPLYSDRAPHDWNNLKLVARDPRCVAWGELGLDNHYEKPAKGTQHAVLAEQLAFIESCRPEIELPVEVHCREAFDDLIPILKGTKLDPARFVFHCFTGTPADARKILDFGAWISFTGVVTYKNAPDVRDAARLVPLDRMMVETDAPFLSPEPFRGVRPNAPRYARTIAEALAALRGLPFEDFESIINDNTRRFFPKLAAADI